MVDEHIDPSLVADLHSEPYFVDFLRDAPEPTGEEDDDACFDAPKIYELVTWYLVPCSSITLINVESCWHHLN